MKRIGREVKLLCENRPPWLKLINIQNLFALEVEIEGHPYSPFAGGWFKLLIKLPRDYPFKPPEISTPTPIHHPAFTNGQLCSCECGIIQEWSWSPKRLLIQLLSKIRNNLWQPYLKGCVNKTVVEEYETNYNLFLEHAVAKTAACAISYEDGLTPKERETWGWPTTHGSFEGHLKEEIEVLCLVLKEYTLAKDLLRILVQAYLLFLNVHSTIHTSLTF
uniref:UBC core domain-containing protein n=1 Tax=Arcella intermedia TaxID=1963864 RepID=A0A6B2LI04_9EUKA